jgi:hypothetical protein
MLNERLKAATDVKASLIPAEEALDTTLVRLGHLTSTMFTARMEAKLSAAFGQDAVTHVTTAIALLGQARSHMVAAHEDLGRTRDAILPTVAWGDDGLKPKGVGTEQIAVERPVRAA